MGKKKVNRIVNAASIPDGKEIIDFDDEIVYIDEKKE